MVRTEVLSIYETHNNYDVEYVIFWNRRLIGRNKDNLLNRIINEHIHGRLGQYPICTQGKLTLEEDSGFLLCNRYVYENMKVFLG